METANYISSEQKHSTQKGDTTMKKTAYRFTLAAILAIASSNIMAQPKQPPKGGHENEQRPGAFQPPKPANQPKPAPQPTVQPKPAPKPEPKPAPRPEPKPAPKPAPQLPPPGGNIFGHHNSPLEKPRERHHYSDWHKVQRNYFYGLGTVNETMQIHLRGREEIEFKIEEQRHDDYRWFARYDSNLIKVDVDHKKDKGFFFGRTPAHAEIEIEGKFPCDTIVELVYARKHAWEKGEPPKKVIRIFVHVD